MEVLPESIHAEQIAGGVRYRLPSRKPVRSPIVGLIIGLISLSGGGGVGVWIYLLGPL
jgi:hypothetical protein